jgi:L1 cell adhesion molecule like protein
LADKFEPADKLKLETAVNEAIKWLDASQEGLKEEYEEKQKELEGIAKYALHSSSGPYFYLPPSPSFYIYIWWHTWWLPWRFSYTFEPSIT